METSCLPVDVGLKKLGRPIQDLVMGDVPSFFFHPPRL